MNVDALIEAWEAWDRKPRLEAEASALEDQCQALAAALGVSCSRLRHELARLRREGCAYRVAVSELLLAVEAA